MPLQSLALPSAKRSFYDGCASAQNTLLGDIKPCIWVEFFAPLHERTA